LSDSCSNSDESQASGNAVGDDGGSSGYNNQGNDNKDWALCDKNNHHFYMIPFQASSDSKPPLN
jgi:hypothetical protein